MTRIVADAVLAGKLRNAQGLLEICDESGQTLGYYQPLGIEGRSLAPGVLPPVTEQELDRREQEEESCSTEELLKYLERL